MNGEVLIYVLCVLLPREPSLYRRSGPIHLKQIFPDFVRGTVHFLPDFKYTDKLMARRSQCRYVVAKI